MSAKQTDSQWENRVLCSDESCIGTIGPDGRCKECGLSYEGELPATFIPGTSDASVAAPSSEDENPSPQTAAEGDTANGAALADTDDEWAQRRLCSDESCIGVIGLDNCCKECGKPYQG